MSIKQSVLRVYNGNPTQGGTFAGTAFFIKPQLLLSAYHVFKVDCPNGAYLQLPECEIWPVLLSEIEQGKTTYGERDIALIHLPRSFPMYCPPLAARNPASGDAVTLWGFFDAQQSLHERYTWISGYVGVQHAFNMAGSIPRGMSGGAVLFEGQLIGLIYARDADKNISYCIPIDAIKEALNKITDTNSSQPQRHHITSKTFKQIKELHEFKDLVAPELIKTYEMRLLDKWFEEYTKYD
ncbi:MAG: hypothetical protein E6Q83_04200 [Thiothrix sp.]|nr:MAG: hypothetical protein E6Q83_04200 [Thiothrix sp.]